MSRLIGRFLDASNSDPRQNTRNNYPTNRRGFGQRGLSNQQYYDDDDYYTTQSQPYYQSRRSVRRSARRAGRNRSPGLISTLINAGTDAYMSRSSGPVTVSSDRASSARPSSQTPSFQRGDQGLSPAQGGAGTRHLSYVSDDSDYYDDDEEIERQQPQQPPRQQWSRPDIFGQQFPAPAPAPQPINRITPDTYQRRSRSEGERQSQIGSGWTEQIPPTYEQIPPTYHEAMRQMSGGAEIAPALPRRSSLR